MPALPAQKLHLIHGGPLLLKTLERKAKVNIEKEQARKW